MVVLVILALGGAARAQTPVTGEWSLPNLSRASTRALAGSQITADSVGRLRVLWRFRFTRSVVAEPTQSPEALRGVVATPIVAGDTVYIQDSTSSVYALGLASGVLRWVHRFRADNFGRNGLSYSSGSVYGSTDTTVFALSAASGRMLWQRRLVTADEQYVDIAPLFANNLVYTSTVSYPPDGRGATYARLTRTRGVVAWKFSTIRGPWRHPALAGGGGAWYTASIDAHGNLSTRALPTPTRSAERLPGQTAAPSQAGRSTQTR